MFHLNDRQTSYSYFVPKMAVMHNLAAGGSPRRVFSAFGYKFQERANQGTTGLQVGTAALCSRRLN